MTSNAIEKHLADIALNDAMLTGENQIFLSATVHDREKVQKQITSLAVSHGLELSGNPFVLPNGANLVFLLTDSLVSAGYSGNAYVLNCFDETNFVDIREMVCSWTLLEKHRAIYLSIE